MSTNPVTQMTTHIQLAPRIPVSISGEITALFDLFQEANIKISLGYVPYVDGLLYIYSQQLSHHGMQFQVCKTYDAGFQYALQGNIHLSSVEQKNTLSKQTQSLYMVTFTQVLKCEIYIWVHKSL